MLQTGKMYWRSILETQQVLVLIRVLVMHPQEVFRESTGRFRHLLRAYLIHEVLPVICDVEVTAATQDNGSFQKCR